MILVIISFILVASLAYANGANDNFKGVASLYGSKTCSFKIALTWGTAMTFLGSLAAIYLSAALLKNFSGKGLVPKALTDSPAFLLSVALGAGGTVLLATKLGFPISTTHGLTGGLVGAGLMNSLASVNFTKLGNSFLLPLLLSPLLAMVSGALIYLILKGTKKSLGIKEEKCICVGEEWLPVSSGNAAAYATSNLTMSVDSIQSCELRYHGSVLGINAKSLIDVSHFMSAGAVSFARGLNDTPKIAALMLVAGGMNNIGKMAITASAMAVGGILNSKNVAKTMSHKLTDMNPGQGFASNLTTALLVTTASYSGLPVSTTHVSVGSLLGMGTVTKQAKWKTVLPVLASWVITLPCAAIVAAFAYSILKNIY
jgi:inorganic phosphate transporter, PiT family